MRPVLTAREMRAVDAQLIRAGVPGIVLMENAGRGAAHLIGLRDRPRQLSEGKTVATARALGGSCVRCADERALGGVSVAVVCGPGNNGGDGSVVARHLLARGADVEVFLVEDEARLTGDASIALAAFRAVGGAVHTIGAEDQLQQRLAAFGLVVDAVLGTGTSRAPTGSVLVAIEAINACGRPVVALAAP
jgi:ADP-dependent NAD(P)H-hydrate dehydratase / NAD(P)H-hydrate epimerase